ncbi:MAG: helix-turn-helix domain-containing protein [Sulfuritalea sp.]|nr:helix-turn-helix domain-containing protein [Sulfuritalea sp.]
MSEAQVTENLDAESIEPVPEEAHEAAEPAASDTPGSVLRLAREARGQSIADVVQVIRFSARQIEALERDDYASLPGATAVRGLVRNYAKFLKLDAAPLLAQLEPAVPVPEADVRPPANMGEAEQPTIVERVPPRLIAAGAAILLLALLGYWAATLSGDGGLTNLLRGLSGGSAVVRPGGASSPSVVPVVQPAPAIVAENAPVAASDASSSLPFTGLRVEFDDRSWIEIRDATQKIVFVGEYPAGTRQNVEGKAPFQVWIGRASGVRMFMGERSIDLKPHTREEVARFTLE